MATFLQFHNAHYVKGELKRAYWVCGPVHRLVEEVIDDIRRTYQPVEVDDVRLFAGEADDGDIWAALNQFPSDEGERVVTVRDADRIRNWDPFLQWLESREMPRSHLLCVSSAPDADTSTPHMHAIVKRGKFIRCGPFTKLDDALTVLMAHSRTPDAGLAKFLYERVAGDMDAALECLWKLSYFDGVPNERIIAALSQPQVSDDFVTALVSGRKREAIALAQQVADEDIPRIIGALDTKLDALVKIWRAVRKSSSLMDIAKATHLAPVTVKELMLPAREYDPRRSRRSAEALAFIDSYRSEGASDLLLETLVATW